MSYGKCFNEANRGRCGYECEAFQNGECEEVGDLLENIQHSGYSQYKQMMILRLYEHPSVMPWWETDK